MYDDLVARLRSVKDSWQAEEESWMLQAADAIEELSTVVRVQKAVLEKFPRWIPVTERLPIRGDRVICFGDNGINAVDFVCGDKWCALPWFYLDGEQETGVTHWMPLPQPPEEE